MKAAPPVTPPTTSGDTTEPDAHTEISPEQARAYASTFLRQRDWDAAEIVIDKILALLPEDPETRHLQAVLRIEQGRLEEAEALLNTLIQQQPEDGGLRNTLGQLYQRQGKGSEAQSAWDWVQAHYPQWPEPWLNRAEAAAKVQAWDTAIPAYQQALRLRPTLPQASIGLALAWVHKDGWAASIPYWQMAVAQNPEDPNLHYRLAQACSAAGHADEAQRRFAEITARWPTHWGAWHALAAHYERQSDLTAARLAAERAFTLARGDPYAERIQSLTLIVQLQRATADWEGLQERQAQLRAAVQKAMETASDSSYCGPFQTLYLPFTAAEQRYVARQWARSVTPIGQTAVTWDLATVQKPGRFRIGYLIADVHNHPNAQNTLLLYGLHDRERFEVFTYSWGEDLAGEHHRFYRERIVGDSEHFIEMKGWSDGEMAARIAADGIQVLIDLMGYTGNNRSAVLARRPAPVQIQYLGYPGTLGADFVDYIIGDDRVTPEARSADFTESILRLPDTYQINSHRAIALERTFERHALGLPETGFVYCCFNSNYKITPEVFARWQQILAAVPDSVLWLLKSNAETEKNLRAEMLRQDLDPARLVFAPFWMRDMHLCRLQSADLFLDTAPCGAHTTAADALWAGVPVLTVPGDTFASRVGASVLHAARLEAAILPDWETYQQRAVALATEDTRTLQRWKTHLRNTRESLPLFDAPARVRALESAYQQVWEAWCPPKEGQD